MLTAQVALVTDTKRLTLDELSQVSAAIQKQVTRDFGPIWGIDATVDAFGSLDHVPLGYWRVLIQDDTGRAEAGLHETRDGQPFALVRLDPGWEMTAGHEVLEMLADPSGRRRVAGDSPHPDQGRVEFLVEICDPCGDPAFGYPVNGVTLSDFCTPSYFDPVAADGVRYSFRSSITQPHEVLKGGYLSWKEPTSGVWWQLSRLEGPAEFVELGPLPELDDASPREVLDRLTARRKPKRSRAAARLLNQAKRVRSAHDDATAAHAAALRREIDGLPRRGAD